MLNFIKSRESVHQNRLVIEPSGSVPVLLENFQIAGPENALGPNRTRTKKFKNAVRTTPAKIKLENIAPTRPDRWENQAVRGSLSKVVLKCISSMNTFLFTFRNCLSYL